MQSVVRSTNGVVMRNLFPTGLLRFSSCAEEDSEGACESRARLGICSEKPFLKLSIRCDLDPAKNSRIGSSPDDGLRPS